MSQKTGDPILDSDMDPKKKIAHLVMNDMGSDILISLLLEAKKDGKSPNVINLFKAYLSRALDREIEQSKEQK